LSHMGEQEVTFHNVLFQGCLGHQM
jgi:hypothetical protein